MAMPDGVEALLQLAAAPQARADAHGLQPGAPSIPSAEEVRDEVRRARFPDADITWHTDVKRQGIVDSWPEDVDDSAARRDWGFAPAYDFDARVPRLPDSDDSDSAMRNEGSDGARCWRFALAGCVRAVAMLTGADAADAIR